MTPQSIFARFFLTLILITQAFSANKSTHLDSNRKTVLITGGAGFIGSNFLDYMFDKHPSYHFLVLDALTYAGDLENISEKLKSSERFEFHHGSVTNQKIVAQLMNRANFVVHFAAESHVSRSIKDDIVFFDTDVLGTRVMMRMLQNSPNVERFIHISTSEVYGSAESNPMNEDHPLNPRSPYAAAKTGADRLVYSYSCTFDLPVVIIRPFNNFGYKQHPEKLIPRLITSALQGQNLTIHDDGQQSRDWVHTLDVARALDKILHTPDFSQIKGETINLGSGKPISVLEVAQKIASYFKYDPSMLQFTGNRPGQVDKQISSTIKSKKLLDWQSEITLDDALSDIIEWYKNHRSWWEKKTENCLVPITVNNTDVIL